MTYLRRISGCKGTYTVGLCCFWFVCVGLNVFAEEKQRSIEVHSKAFEVANGDFGKVMGGSSVRYVLLPSGKYFPSGDQIIRLQLNVPEDEAGEESVSVHIFGDYKAKPGVLRQRGGRYNWDNSGRLISEQEHSRSISRRYLLALALQTLKPGEASTLYIPTAGPLKSYRYRVFQRISEFEVDLNEFELVSLELAFYVGKTMDAEPVMHVRVPRDVLFENLVNQPEEYTFEQMRRLALQGDVDAMADLGVIRFNGHNSPYDPAGGYMLLLHAAQNGNSRAMFLVGQFGYLTSKGRLRPLKEALNGEALLSLEESIDWLKKAQKAGEADAAILLEKIRLEDE